MYIYALTPKYDYLTKEMRKRVNRAFWLYAKEYGTAKACLYWLQCRIINPTKRVLAKESLFSFCKRRFKAKLLQY